MQTLTRVVPRVRIVPLTTELARLHDTAASACLVGDRTCSLDNMRRSCFASELCAQSRPLHMSLRSFVGAPLALVALVREDDGGESFGGCVCAGAPEGFRALFSQLDDKRDVVLSNLCVSEARRGLGIGRALLERTREWAMGRPLYLTVARAASATDADVVTAFEERVARLIETYERCRFRQCASCAEALLLRDASV